MQKKNDPLYPQMPHHAMLILETLLQDHFESYFNFQMPRNPEIRSTVQMVVGSVPFMNCSLSYSILFLIIFHTLCGSMYMGRGK